MERGIRLTKRFWLIYALAWIPYALTYGAVFLTQAEARPIGLLAAIGRNIIPAALLGLGVIWICNRLPWPLHRRIWFFPLHFLFAAVYSLVWTGVLFFLLTLSAYQQTGVWRPVSFVGNALQWQIFTGIMLYATIASIVYVLQAVQNLREEERRSARAETLYARNALAALQARLNPHFLFNTLHTLMALVRYHPERAEDALEKLAAMLRYSLPDKRGKEKYLVRLEDELGFVDNYLDLEKLRLGDRLRVVKEIQPETLDCLLPPFTVQPLVENSIKHGITPKNITAAVFVRAEREGLTLRLEVGDDGIGADPAEIATGGGLGLDLICEQLRILYADEGIFEIDTAPGRGFRVKIELPVRYAEQSPEEKKPEIEYTHVNS